jgi:hypothetical protein
VFNPLDTERREKSLELMKAAATYKRAMVSSLNQDEIVPMKRNVQTLKKAKETKFMGESYFNLEPTLSMDYAPNNQEKIYNTLRLSYIKDESTGRMRDYAEAKCILQIPKLVKISKKPAGLNT